MPGVDPEVASACREAASGLRQPADATTRGELLEKFAPAAEIYGVLAGVECVEDPQEVGRAGNCARYGPLVQDRLRARPGDLPAPRWRQCEPSFEALKLAWTKFFLTYDFLVMPATPFPALAKADCTPANRLRMLGLTAPASLGGLPALTIPVPLASGMSAGLQIDRQQPRRARSCRGRSGSRPWAEARRSRTFSRRPG